MIASSEICEMIRRHCKHQNRNLDEAREPRWIFDHISITLLKPVFLSQSTQAMRGLAASIKGWHPTTELQYICWVQPLPTNKRQIMQDKAGPTWQTCKSKGDPCKALKENWSDAVHKLCSARNCSVQSKGNLHQFAFSLHFSCIVDQTLRLIKGSGCPDWIACWQASSSLLG